MPSVCVNEPLPGHAFCSYHVDEVLKENKKTGKNTPVKLREFNDLLRGGKAPDFV